MPSAACLPMLGAGSAWTKRSEGSTGFSELWVAKIFGPAKPLLSRVGDRQPELQTLVVPQRQCLRLAVGHPLHRFLTSCLRYNDTINIVARITKTGLHPWWGTYLHLVDPPGQTTSSGLSFRYWWEGPLETVGRVLVLSTSEEYNCNIIYKILENGLASIS
jgi:hypothetical protein